MSKKILVADDEAHIRHIVSMKLSNAGYEVVTAEDGEEALELAQAETPELIITDYQMPYLTGLEMCRKLRDAKVAGEVPVLMLTARGFDIEPDEMAAAGISDVLSKPFSPREVLQKVHELIGQAEETQEVIESS
ncbi:MAG: response regulator [Planctomycetota bacterium]